MPDALMVFACMLKKKALRKIKSLRLRNARKIVCIQVYFGLFQKQSARLSL